MDDVAIELFQRVLQGVRQAGIAKCHVDARDVDQDRSRPPRRETLQAGKRFVLGFVQAINAKARYGVLDRSAFESLA
jgi:hypothetical protein